MPSFGSASGNVLYLIVTAAPPARDIVDRVKTEQGDGWEVCVVATPAALAWIDVEQIEAVTGHPVRTEFRLPDEPGFEPLGDAVLMSPATFNTINKWALGINDNLALGLLNEALGRGVPISIEPYANDALTSSPRYQQSLAYLADQGVKIGNHPQST